jgi:hypothetical protein
MRTTFRKRTSPARGPNAGMTIDESACHAGGHNRVLNLRSVSQESTTQRGYKTGTRGWARAGTRVHRESSRTSQFPARKCPRVPGNRRVSLTCPSLVMRKRLRGRSRFRVTARFAGGQQRSRMVTLSTLVRHRCVIASGLVSELVSKVTRAGVEGRLPSIASPFGPG